MNTYTEIGEYKGNPLFKINYLDKDGEERTLISFGTKKAQAICEHIDLIRQFAEKGERHG
jgi:uncharacterized protein YpmB